MSGRLPRPFSPSESQALENNPDRREEVAARKFPHPPKCYGHDPKFNDTWRKFHWYDWGNPGAASRDGGVGIHRSPQKSLEGNPDWQGIVASNLPGVLSWSPRGPSDSACETRPRATCGA